jgi:hypothetical protein
VSDRRRSGLRALTAAALVVVVVLAAGGVRAQSPAAYPALPIGLDREFLGNLSGPSLSPGTSGAIDFSVSDPLTEPLVDVLLTLSVYAFNGFPGNLTGPVPVAGAPVLTTATTSGAYANVSIGNVVPRATTTGSVGVASSSTTPAGTFAVRTALAFSENATDYLLESRGWFSTAQWEAATQLPNGSVTLNLTVLGVSGVLPETAVLVSSTTLDWALFAIAGVGVVLVGLGAWVYYRRDAKSSGGAR